MRISQLFQHLLPAHWLLAAAPDNQGLDSLPDDEVVGSEIDLQALQVCSAGMADYGWDDAEEFCQLEMDTNS